MRTVTRSAVRRWIVRLALLIVAWRGISSGQPVVSAIALFVFVSLLLKSIDFGAIAPPTLREGDTRIVIQEANTGKGDRVTRVLVNYFNIDHFVASNLLENLPVTLEPAVIRSQAEDVVARLNKAGAVASIVVVDDEEEHH